MPRYYADLHSHSTASDGSDPPARVVERARERGLHVLALTDHDTVAGVAEAREAGKRHGIQVIAGTELTCYIGCVPLLLAVVGI
ncbi:MAG: PHP domain-containing protein, partial [Candidatus Sumerlaeota bacterium]